MDSAAITHRGMEDISGAEIEEIAGSKAQASDTVLLFDADDKSLAKLCYMSRSLIKVLRLLSASDVNNNFEETMEYIKAGLEKADLSIWLKGRSFKVKCVRHGIHDYSSQDIAPALGEFILEKARQQGIETSVKMSDPDIVVYVYILDERCCIGIDFSGFDLSKRDYRVFSHPGSISCVIAYGLLRIGGYESIAKKKQGMVIDPFCGSGTIPIEAALYAKGLSPHFFRKDRFSFHKFIDIDLSSFDPKADSKAEQKKEGNSGVFASDFLLRYVKAVKNNAKLAGVEKDIEVTKMDIEWLDTRLDEKSVDLIVTDPPAESRFNDAKQIEKLYKEFVHQAEFVLKKQGKIVVCTRSMDAMKARLESKFRIISERSVWQGGEELNVLVAEKA